ncbi:hypothetical protein J437_LFUL003735 [Ladona fulva]|uniref:PiggyBac transposable element-derived protein domain-containing protein n=1 Tax=Ladona fulva TaxID=123851 RepID=A0A8K0NW67_LADFU|nr:hypothetical protein J437_LFUL003735 [Ladona fulva]
MVEPILGTCRNVTVDNWFTSVPLAEDLLQSKLTLVGTIKKNKRELPQQMVYTKKMEEASITQGRQNTMEIVFLEIKIQDRSKKYQP